MDEPLLEDARQRMEKSLRFLEHELAKLRLGRANPAMVEDIRVDYYGTHVPLKHIAAITAPEADLLVVRPFDKTQIQAIEKAIQSANLGFNPVVDGELLRLKVPRLTEERRKEFAKLIKQHGEDTKVALRNIRRDAKEQLEALKKEGRIGEDDYNHRLKELDRITHDYTVQVDQKVQAREQQLMAI